MQNLKMVMRLIGVSDVSIQFDGENHLINASFLYQGQRTSKQIPFKEIEALFQNTENIPDMAAQQPSEVDLDIG